VNTLQRTATHFVSSIDSLYGEFSSRTATHCNALQRTATHCVSSIDSLYGEFSSRTATRCNTLCQLYRQFILWIELTHCNALQHTATHCNALQHTLSALFNCELSQFPLNKLHPRNPPHIKKRLHSSVSRGTHTIRDFGLSCMCAEKFEFLNLVDLRGVVFSMETE